ARTRDLSDYAVGIRSRASADRSASSWRISSAVSRMSSSSAITTPRAGGDHEARKPPGHPHAEQAVERERAWPRKGERARDRDVRRRELGPALVHPDRLVAVLLSPGDDHRRDRHDRTRRTQKTERGERPAGELRRPGDHGPFAGGLDADLLEVARRPLGTAATERTKEVLRTVTGEKATGDGAEQEHCERC